VHAPLGACCELPRISRSTPTRLTRILGGQPVNEPRRHVAGRASIGPICEDGGAGGTNKGELVSILVFW
jgi:hypothetical protein